VGADMIDGGPVRGRALAAQYLSNDYHKPSDELTASWDMTGGAEDLAALYAVGRRLADGSEWPEWRPTSEFRAAREASRKQ
jgi:hypothetical protein